jgi:hypothetical protein
MTLDPYFEASWADGKWITTLTPNSIISIVSKVGSATTSIPPNMPITRFIDLEWLIDRMVFVIMVFIIKTIRVVFALIKEHFEEPISFIKLLLKSCLKFVKCNFLPINFVNFEPLL